ncbi:hypothetical protein B296_00053695 [Ensete ventricosum]|uniref:Reverse transcriptase domain-containing protein n=1 Tax=Ensete ventricosum TaxID=4639 RepID=A0A426WVT0_ENSVE|nr:hypothetical protein B296_00053695 [Ensete ventricosum]
MVQTIVPYLPQLVHSTAHRSAPSAAPPRAESPATPNRGVPPEVEPSQPQVVETRTASPTLTPARSQSRSYNPVPTEPDFDTLSTNTADSLREQVRRVHQRLDEVQKEVLKSRGEVGESSKGGSPFTPEIQAKPLPATFRLPALEPYDGSDDPTEHIVAFRAQMTLYDTSDVLMCRAFRLPLEGRPEPDRQGPVEKQIDVIFGEPASGGNSSSARKTYVRSEVGKRPLHDEDLDVTFRSGGEEHPSHDDALVISIRMANTYVKRVMIDTGSLADILYFDAFQRLGLTDRDLAALTSTLTGFTRDFVSPLGVTMILVTFGREPKSKTLMVSFMVVKLPSAYNTIIGHPTLNQLRAVVSTYHWILKFPTRAGVGEVRSDLRKSRQCYLTATTLSKKPRTQPVGTMPQDPEDNFRDPHSAEKFLELPLDPTDAHLRALAYRRVVTKLYNSRVCPRHVEMGDLVLRKTEVSDPTRSRGKLAPNWEGPYRVVDVIRDGTYTLVTMEGRVLPRT